MVSARKIILPRLLMARVALIICVKDIKLFSKHIDQPMKYMTQKLRANQAPSDIKLTDQ
jgi:hypothetical protein